MGQSKAVEAAIKRTFKNVSTKALIRRIEKAPDFGYDEEACELSRRLKAVGKTWGWEHGDWKTPPFVIVEDVKR